VLYIFKLALHRLERLFPRDVEHPPRNILFFYFSSSVCTQQWA